MSEKVLEHVGVASRRWGYVGIVVGLERVHMLWGVALCTRVQCMCNVVELP